MKRSFITRLAVVIAAVSLATTPLHARGQKSSSTAPGTYKEWGPDIDQLEIVKTFRLADYERIVVEPLETKDVALPEKSDNTYEPVTIVLAHATEPFVHGLRANVGTKVDVSEKTPKAARTLLLRVTLVELAPGSKAARYWGGFGAGATRAKLRGEIVDARSGGVLARFEQERRSGVGVMGGDYQKLMERSLDAVGEDVANLLKAF